jgi:hypothetical protein
MTFTSLPADGEDSATTPREDLEKEGSGEEEEQDDDDEEEDEEEQERVYAAAQALLGNLNVNRLPIEKDKDGLAGEEDEALQRGRGAIFLLNLPESKVRSRSFLLQRADERLTQLAERSAGRMTTTTKSTTQNCRFLLSTTTTATTTPMADTAATTTAPVLPWWKILQGPISSASHVTVANGLIARALILSSRYDPKGHNAQQQQKLYQLAHNHLLTSLDAWNCNPVALSCLANLVRMGVLLPSSNNNNNNHHHNQKSLSSSEESMSEALDLYRAASEAATWTRVLCLNVLHESEDIIGSDDKALVEGIVLALCAQVALIDEDEDKNDTKQQAETNAQGGDDDIYSASAVVSTSSYMAALLASTLGQHDLAYTVLRRRFCSHGCGMTRIHPAVWKSAGAASSRGVALTPVPPFASLNAAFVPAVYQEAISLDFYRILRHAFRPDSPYWAESGYDRGVYYSFWIDWPLPPARHRGSAAGGGAAAAAAGANKTSLVVSNAIEHAVVEHLLPRVRSLLSAETLATLAGFEWWVHTRPLGANVGHQLHFDTDEALLEQDGIVDYPICASVLYLTSKDEDGVHFNQNQRHHHRQGATVIFDQTPATTSNAERAWIGVPKSRSFVVFPGDLLHGVLPCANHSEKEEVEEEAPMRRKRKAPTTSGKKTKQKEQLQPPPPHRLTFMVNFWSKSIPARLRKRKLYGPSGPFPPPTRSHSWVNDINQGYPKAVTYDENDHSSVVDTASTFQGQPLGCASPAWEVIRPAKHAKEVPNDYATLGPPVEPPKALNQRFFVRNAPAYFASTLYEK